MESFRDLGLMLEEGWVLSAHGEGRLLWVRRRAMVIFPGWVPPCWDTERLQQWPSWCQGREGSPTCDCVSLIRLYFIFYRGRMQVFMHLDFPRQQKLQVPTGNQGLCPRHLQVSSFVPCNKYHVGWIQLQRTCWDTFCRHWSSRAWETRKCFYSVPVRIIGSAQWRRGGTSALEFLSYL